MEWAKQIKEEINREICFNKATMDNIVSRTLTAYLNTAEQGILILICQPCRGSETSDIRLKEQAMQLTAQNQTLTEALLLGNAIHITCCDISQNKTQLGLFFAYCCVYCLGTCVTILRLSCTVLHVGLRELICECTSLHPFNVLPDHMGGDQ